MAGEKKELAKWISAMLLLHYKNAIEIQEISLRLSIKIEDEAPVENIIEIIFRQIEREDGSIKPDVQKIDIEEIRKQAEELIQKMFSASGDGTSGKRLIVRPVKHQQLELPMSQQLK
ncbi:MAG TPA: hypothetical protein DCE56_00625 [Cyanobacteria bacterium UBA8553]|nr:hypothetical protein [Cyanobacteria bacterium UBA8553]